MGWETKEGGEGGRGGGGIQEEEEIQKVPLTDITGEGGGREEEGEEKSKESQEGFDTALELVGSWGRWQKTVFVVASCSQIFSAIHAVLAAFLSFTPEHWCRVEALEDEAATGGGGGGGGVEAGASTSTLLDLRSVSIPRSEEGWAKCEYYDYNYTALLDLNTTTLLDINTITTTVPTNVTAVCDSWVFDDSVFTSTLVTEFSLVCGRRWMMATVQASYMSGLLIGSLVMGQLSDRFGRRMMAVVCVVCSCVVGTCAAFVTSYIQFLALRFFVAFFNAGIMVINFVLVLEVVKPSARTMCGMIYAFFFGLGIASLPGLVYFVRDWRHLEMIIGLLSSSLVAYYWILPESPRWLASQKRGKEAVKILKDIARTNGKTVPPDPVLLELVSRVYHKKTEEQQDNAHQTTRWYSGLLGCSRDPFILLRTPVMRRRALICFYLWFSAASVYYGLIFSGGNIKADPFLMIFISGLVELPSSAIFIHPINRWGRRPTTCALFMACAASLFAILAVPQDRLYVNFSLVTLSKFFTTPVFQLQYIYTSELFPTSVRNLAVGTSSMMARIGCVITPYIITLLGDVHYALPSTVFAVFSMSAGLLTLLLPETTNTLLPETTQEVEASEK